MPVADIAVPCGRRPAFRSAWTAISYLANVGNYELYGMNIETQNEIYDVPCPIRPLTPLPYVTPFFHIAATTSVGTPVGDMGLYALGRHLRLPIRAVPRAPTTASIDHAGGGPGRERRDLLPAAPNFAIDQTRYR